MEQEEKHNQRAYFVQRHTVGGGRSYLYFEANCWYVSASLGKTGGWLRNTQDTLLPPSSGWDYSDGSWMSDDTTLGLEFSSLSSCRMIRVEGDVEVRKHRSTELGDYRLQTNKWSCGRPVYQLVNSAVERYLLVQYGQVEWRLKSSVNTSTAFIQSGKATNSPTSAEAGPKVKDRLTRWRYDSNSVWKEGDITVSCII